MLRLWCLQSDWVMKVGCAVLLSHLSAVFEMLCVMIS